MANHTRTGALTKFTTAVENARELDTPAAIFSSLAGRVYSPRVRAALRPGGHPLHPALATAPIGAWLAAGVLDLTLGDARAARRLVGFGLLAAVPTAAAGTAEWLGTTGEAKRVGFAHAALNDVALVMFVSSYRQRGRGNRAGGAALGFTGLALTAAAGWLGGHLAYRLGVGQPEPGVPVNPEPGAADNSAEAVPVRS